MAVTAGEGSVASVSDVSQLRQGAAAGAVVTAMALGMRDVLAPPTEGPAVVVPYPELDDTGEPITLYFHPEVPEATLVLLRRRPRAART